MHRDSAQAPGVFCDRVLERAKRHAIARLCGKERNFSGEHFWARGYAVSTVGFELEQVRIYIREQAAADGAAGHSDYLAFEAAQLIKPALRGVSD